MSVFDFECAVIGGGPAGLVSSLYLGRFRRSVILFNGGTPRASWIPRTHNLLGYRGGISGAELLRRLRAQCDDVGVERVADSVRIEEEGKSGFVVEGEKGSVRVRRVIIATGVEDVQPVVDGVADLRKRGLLRYCPICDAYEYSGKRIAVLAQDDHGLKTSLFLVRFAKQVECLLSAECRVSGALLRACATAGVRVHRARLTAMEPRPGGGIWLAFDHGRGVRAEIAYVALGAVVHDLAFRHLGLERAEDGRLRAGARQALGVPGLFAVGDCVDSLAQISVAAGQAAVAATAIHNGLEADRRPPKQDKGKVKTEKGAHAWN